MSEVEVVMTIVEFFRALGLTVYTAIKSLCTLIVQIIGEHITTGLA
jgi:hypothetical protein